MAAQWKGVVKVQRSLAGNGQPSMLIYNENRSIMHQDVLTGLTAKEFGAELKLYIWAILRRDGQLVLDFNRRFDNPGW